MVHSSEVADLAPLSSSSSSSSEDPFSRPRPRPPRSPSQTAKVRVQNRRREYLERTPGYFTSAEHEFADPDLYDTFIRRFQTPAEREAEGRARGWGRTLESSLMRGEARLDRLASSYTGDRPTASSGRTRQISGTTTTTRTDDSSFTIDSYLAEENPTTREEGRRRWEEFLRERFVHGGDEDFDYAPVDGNEELDLMEDRDREEEWFDGEEPEWADDSDDDDDNDEEEDEAEEQKEKKMNRGSGGTTAKPKRERVLMGETGIQDY